MSFNRPMAALAAALCLFSAVSCGGRSSSSSSDTAPAETSSAISENGLSERITPSEGDEEYELGDYYIAPDGVKLYFEPEEFPEELALTMKNYFQAFAAGDYDSYVECLYPSYIEEMNKFLEKDYEYDLKTSFENQVQSLRDNMGEDFTVSRIRLETYSDDVTGFFEYPSSCFDKDYYAEIKDQVDNFYDAMFFIMAKGTDTGEETLLVSEYEIVFAEKDGRFYTFG